MIDLGKKPEVYEAKIEKVEDEEAEKKVYYPRLYISDIEMPEAPEGDFVAKVKLCKVSSTKNHKTGEYSCEFEVKGISFDTKVERKESFTEKLEEFLDME